MTFHGLDGDDGTVKFSKPLFAGPDGLATANAVLQSSTGTIDADATNDGPPGLQFVNFSGRIGVADGVGFTVSARRNTARGGGGFADVGFVNAAGLDLRAISIAGDLGRIVAGDGANADAPAVRSLTVQSVGELGLSTQAAGATLPSTITGPLGALTIKGHLRDATRPSTSPARLVRSR